MLPDKVELSSPMSLLSRYSVDKVNFPLLVLASIMATVGPPHGLETVSKCRQSHTRQRRYK
jgi:hypothetical protein